MAKKDNIVIDKKQYKHYLIDTVELLTQENKSLKQQLDDLTKDYNHLISSTNTRLTAEH